MSQLVMITTIICFIFFNHVHSFTIQPRSRPATGTIIATGRTRKSFTTSSSKLNAIEVPSLDGLDNNHEKEAARLAKSIIGWLDREWFPQEVHVQMATCVEKSFLKARNEGETEVGGTLCCTLYSRLLMK